MWSTHSVAVGLGQAGGVAGDQLVLLVFSAWTVHAVRATLQAIHVRRDQSVLLVHAPSGGQTGGGTNYLISRVFS